MKRTSVSSLKASLKRGRRLAPALLLTAFLSCTTEVVGPQIGTELVLATSAGGAVNGVPFATAPSVHIVDEQGNTVTDANFPVTLTVSSGATVIGSSTVSAVDGIAVFNTAGLTGPTGTYTLTYTATLAVGPRTVSQSITLAPGAAARYIVTPSASSATVGTPVTINAQLVDANDSPISAAGRVVIWTASGANGSFATPTSSTNPSGLATVTYTVDTVDGRTATITATDNNSISGSTTVHSLTGAAAKLAFNVQPSAAGWRTVIRPSVIVTVQDRYSNTVASGATPVMLAIGANPGGANLSGGENTPSSGGIATFPNVMFDEPGSGYTLIASSPGLTSATSSSFDVSPIGILVRPASSDQCLKGGCSVKSLAVSASTVYFTPCIGTGPNDRFCSLSAIARTGGEANKLGDAVSEQFSFNTYGGRLIVDGTHIDRLQVGGVIQRSGAIVRAPLAGGSSPPLRVAAPSASSGPDLEFDGTSFYMNWSPAIGDGTSGIGRTRASDEVSQVLVSHFSPFAVAGGQLYFESAGTIEKMSVDSGPTTTVVTGVGGLGGPSYRWRQMLVVDNTIYWVESGGLLRSAPISGGVATTRGSGVSGNLVSDGSYLYATGSGSVLRFSLTDFSVTTVATDGGIVDIALDSQAVYWGTSDGFVKKAPK